MACLLAWLAAGWGLASAARADWPLIRQNSSATGVASSPVTMPLEELWTYEAEGSGFEATACIVDGVVYVGDLDGTFHAIRLADGQPLWKRKFAGEVRLTGDKPLWTPSGVDCGFIAGAAVVDGSVYCIDFNGALRRLDAQTGELLWQFSCESELYAAPNVHEGRLLIVTDVGELLSLDAETGLVQWTFSIDQPLRCWPTVVGGQAVVAGCDAQLHAVDVQTGQSVAQHEIAGPADAIPAVRGDRIFFCTAGGVFHAFDMNPLGPVWQFRSQGQGEEIHAAAVTDELVIFGTHRKEIVALDASTGEQKWSFSLRSRAESSPVVAGQYVLLATIRGRLYALDVATGTEAWQLNLGGRFTASPAVSDGKLVIGNEDGKLYCFGSRP